MFDDKAIERYAGTLLLSSLNLWCCAFTPIASCTSERLSGIWFRMTSDTCVPNLKFWLWYINPAMYVIAHVLALVNASVKGTGTAGALLDDGRTKLATN